jgi:hypothetical protein
VRVHDWTNPRDMHAHADTRKIPIYRHAMNFIAGVLAFLGVVAGGVGVKILKISSTTDSAIHDIEGLLCFVAAAVLLGAAGVVAAIATRTSAMENELKTLRQLATDAAQRDLQRLMKELRSDGSGTNS